MEYKIRANNQKEAVEVYKAIRQIQQGKHNIAVNADSRKDAVRIYKEAKRVCDSKKVKDEDYKLMRAIIDICKKYNYYTYGTLDDYNKLLNRADKMDLVDIATNIAVHSDENDSRKIEQILKKELGYRGIVKDEKLIDDARIKKNITHASSHAENSKIKDFIVGNMEAYEWWNKHGGTGYWDDDLILEWPFDTKKRATEYFNEMKSALPNVKMHLAKKRNRYVIVFDSKFTDSKLKDKQNLVRGDWFVRINDLTVGSYVNIPLYKVLDMQTHDDGMIYVDVYHIKSDIKQNKTMLVHGGTSWFKLNNGDRYGVGLSGLTIFSSADEALKWAKQIVATRNAKR